MRASGNNNLTKKSTKRLKNAKTRNEFEHKIQLQIKELLKRGDTVEYEAEKIPYSIDHVYVPDFIITLKSGRKIYIETKGNGRAWTPQVMQKMLAVRAQNPDLDIRIVFYKDGEFGQRRKDGSRQRQSDWATKHKFKFSIGDVPEDWFNE